MALEILSLRPRIANLAMSDSHTDRSAAPASSERRSFLAWGSIVLGGIMSLFPVIVGLIPLTDVWRKRKPPRKYDVGSEGPEGYTRVAELKSLPVGGPPQMLPVVAAKTDAWNYMPNQAIGAVFVERIDEEAVRVFNATCPHAGCSVAFESDAYYCPCHNSSFALDGQKLESQGKENPSPRPLDSLDVDPSMLAQGEVWVKFENYFTGKEEKIPKA